MPVERSGILLWFSVFCATPRMHLALFGRRMMARVQNTGGRNEESPNVLTRNRPLMGRIRTLQLRILAPVFVLLQVLLLAQVTSAAPLNKAPPVTPLPPTFLTATAFSNSQIDLLWDDPNTGSGSPSESGYEVWRRVPPSSTWNKVFASGRDVTHWSDTGLAAGTTYSYRVRAFIVAQRKTTYSDYSPDATATTTSGTLAPPTPGAVTPSNTQFGNLVSSPFDLATGFASSTSVVTSCEYSMDGGSTWVPATVSGAMPSFTCSKTGITGTNGQALGLTMRATNSGGSAAATAAARTVDAAAPSTSSNAASGWVASDQTVTLTPSDAGGSGIAGTKYCTDASNSCAPATSGTSVGVSCAVGAVCQTYVRFQSTDNVGNPETVKSSLVRIDKSAPTTTSNAPAGWVSLDQTVTLSAVDSGAGVASTQYCLDTSNTCTPAITGTSVSVTCAAGTACQTYVRFRSTDAAGGVEITKTALVRIDKAAPVTTSNASAGWVASDQTVILSAGDTGAGVASTQYCSDTINTCTPATAGASVPVDLCGRQRVPDLCPLPLDRQRGHPEAVKSALVRIDKALPRDGTLSASPSSGQVVLSWTAGSDVGSGLSASTPYKLVFSTGGFPANCSSGTVLTNGTAMTWTHTGLTNGTPYYYRVCDADATGNVSIGATASATPAGTNQPPVANAGPAQSAQTLTSLTFNGSGSSDPDGTIASYAWTFGDGGSASGMTVSHSYASAGTYTATLTVTDNLGATGSATAAVTISNRPPVANIGPDQNATVGAAVTLNGSGSSDPDGTNHVLQLELRRRHQHRLRQRGYGQSPLRSAGVYTATLTVTDNKGATASDTAVITVTSAAAGGAFGWAKRFGSSGEFFRHSATAPRSTPRATWSWPVRSRAAWTSAAAR